MQCNLDVKKTSPFVIVFVVMDEYLCQDAKKGLLYIDILEDFERKRFLRTVVNTATTDFKCK